MSAAATPSTSPSIHSMAQDFYGYGRWSAPYWFIGPEQGGNDNDLRAKIFDKLEIDGLCDCKEFHREIQVKDWHFQKPNPKLQPTWNKLILLLETFLGRPSNRESRRAYQRDSWGQASGETLVIELSGLSQRKLSNCKARSEHLEKRLQTIRTRITQQIPRLVVLYGASEEEHWGSIAGQPWKQWEARKREQSIFAFAAHPNARYTDNQAWEDLGNKARGLLL